MLPSNARVNDIVEVTNEDSEYYGMIGRIVEINGIRATIELFGKHVIFYTDALYLKARVGTNKHQELTSIIESRQTKDLTWDDLNELMDHALDVGDYQWAFELKQRRDTL